MKKIELIDEEIILKNNIYIESDTDLKGIITFANDYFCEISGYTKEEIEGKPHNIVRHPDMPKAIFKILWDHLKREGNFIGVIKNLAKDGRYYWVFTDFEIIREKDGRAVGYQAIRKNISKNVTNFLDPLYKQMVDIEKKDGVDASVRYLNKYLSDFGDDITIDNLLDNIHRLY